MRKLVDQAKPVQGAWTVLAFMFTIGFFMFGLLVFISPLLSYIKGDLGLTYAEFGLIFAVPLAILAALSLPSGLISDRFGPYRAVGIGATLMGLGTVLRGFSFDFTSLLGFSVLFGLGMGFTLANFPKLVRVCFPARLVGTASGVWGAGSSAGMGLTLAVTLTVMMPLLGSWRTVSHFWGYLDLAVAAGWLLIVRRYPAIHSLQRRESHKLGGLRRRVLKDRCIWFATVLLFVENFTFYALTGFLPTYAVARDISPTIGSFMTSAYVVSGIPAIALVPMISDRLRRRKPFFIYSTVSASFAFFFFIAASETQLWTLMAILGVAANVLYILALTVPADVVETRILGFATGLILSVGYSGGLLGPWIFGYIVDFTNSFALGFYLLTAVMLGGVAASLTLTETARVRPR
ncbi:MAG: CynX/NimT family MFS transporter [Candidatus Bathyarchaeia archaeon]